MLRAQFRLLPIASLVVSLGCASGGDGIDAGGGRNDAGPAGDFDAGKEEEQPLDAGPGGGFDAGPGGGTDAGGVDGGSVTILDGGAPTDGGATDAGALDAGPGGGSGLMLTPGFNMMIPGSTTGGPTWLRPLASGACPASGFSAVGTMVPYAEHQVVNAGSSTLTVSLASTASYDGYLVVYDGTAIPTDPLMCLEGDDDAGAGFDPMTSFMLAPGAQALIIVTGFDNDDHGPYTLTISAS